MFRQGFLPSQDFPETIRSSRPNKDANMDDDDSD